MPESREKGSIVTGYAKMWPREVFDVRAGNKYLGVVKERLSTPGVYVLYRDDRLYYIGQAKSSLFRRLRRHSIRPRDPYYNFWNFFSAFSVPEIAHIGEVEAILIASAPSANRAVPKIPRIQFPDQVGKILHKRRYISLEES